MRWNRAARQSPGDYERSGKVSPWHRCAAWFVLVAAIVQLAAGPCAAQSSESLVQGDIDVSVNREGGRYRIEASFYADASISIAWSVLTDFENAPAFLSDLEFSTIDRREGDVFFVRQKGRAKFGPLEFPVESYRRIELFQNERIETRLLRGTMKQLDGTVRLNAEGAGTRIVSQTDLIPDFWLPPFVGSLFVEHEALERFAELRREMLRRKGKGVSEEEAPAAKQTLTPFRPDAAAQRSGK